MNPHDLKALGVSAQNTNYSYSEPDFGLLETFVSPMHQEGGFSGEIYIEIPEFTSLCPITGQPDFATIVIKYRPYKLCVESKSLKLYMGGFRMHGEFHESCVSRITQDLVKLLDPLYLEVEGRFTPRGGIPFWPKQVYTRAG